MALQMPLTNLCVVLVKPRFPENIGMAARACANMGCPNLALVQPERWDPLKAEPLATAQGWPVLEKMRIYTSLAECLSQFNYVAGTTARLGGYRRRLASPETFADQMLPRADEKIALVFGPEDRGLTNAELFHCQEFVHIPVDANASSLNLAQAILIMLYECRKARLSARNQTRTHRSKPVKREKLDLLERNLEEALIRLDCISDQNPAYFFRLWQELLARARISEREYAALMGLCRQIKNKIPK